jgi:hypothetical protein
MTPEEIAADVAASACYCFSEHRRKALDTYALAVIVGGSTDPATLMAAAKCFTCMSETQLLQVQVLSADAGGGGGGAVPAAPEVGAASDVFYNQFTANWGSSAGATGYRLDVSTSNLFGSFVAGYNDKVVVGTSQVVTGLSGATSYYYRVRAINSAGTSANSSTNGLTTPNDPIACAVTNFSSVVAGGGDAFDCYSVGGPYTALAPSGAGTGYSADWILANGDSGYAYGDDYQSYTEGPAGTLNGGTGSSVAWVIADSPKGYYYGDSFDTYVVGPAPTMSAGTGFTGSWEAANSLLGQVVGDSFDTYTVGAAGTLNAGTGFTGDWIYA